MDNIMKPFSCPEENCTKEYTNKSHLDRHINSVHKKTELNILFCCPYCMKKYSNRQNLKRHIEKSHKDDRKSYQCDYCSKLFRNKTDISIHMYKHTGVKAFRCTVCHKEFIKNSHKNQHMKKHKEYPCQECDSKFYKLSHLLSHQRSHHLWSEYICNDCGKKFKNRSGIIRHVKVHVVSPVFTLFFCHYSNCKKYYTRNSNLKQHILIKHKDQRFDCPLCPMRLASKARLEDHLKRHEQPAKDQRRNPKTIETGRLIRKDRNSLKYSTAMKLAGIKDVEKDTIAQNNVINGNEKIWMCSEI
ncbi:gastrula zinc finger protein XlCGF8.2DB-like isoform X2 [Aricia agestis]|uniref:gastrula zinc finger protein XlCGF8.2DB-like isoform X2 n=1 Tax=Aricia agestis TaxID=91739 RepID=UPI001C203754|nr:gastrula zinc finger protein XlCGF8.2DB-like isoform X2 [Aricia agestis]